MELVDRSEEFKYKRFETWTLVNVTNFKEFEKRV